MKVCVAAALIVSYPLAVVVNVRGFWMALSIGLMILLWCRCLGSTTGVRGRSMRRYESSADFAAAALSPAATMFLPMLRKRK